MILTFITEKKLKAIDHMDFVMYTDGGVAIRKRHILGLLGIHKTGGFRAGAKLYGMDKDAMRKELRCLQVELGVQLYVRCNKGGLNGAQITEIGMNLVRIYAEYCSYLWSKMQSFTMTMEEFLNERKDDGVGTFTRLRDIGRVNE